MSTDASDICKVVRIATPIVPGSPHGFTEINESDFDAKKHKLFVEAPAKQKSATQIKAEAKAKADQDAADAEAARVAAEDKAKAEAANGWAAPSA